MTEIRLQTSGGLPLILDPPFAPGTSDYAVQISRAEISLILFWNARDPGARVFFNGDEHVDPSGQRDISVEAEKTTLTFRLRGTNLTQKTYTMIITKERALSSVSTLNGLSLGSYVLEPAFSPEILEYTVRVPAGVKLKDLESLLSYERGDESQTISLFTPLNESPPMTFRIQVTAEDQSVRTYRLNVIGDT